MRMLLSIFNDYKFGLIIVLFYSILSYSFTQFEHSNTSIEGSSNINLILVDDMGYADIGSYNPVSKIPTPNIDGLAEEGLSSMDAQAPGGVCHFSRYGLLTGRYPLIDKCIYKII